MWLPCAEGSQKPPPSGGLVRHHLQHHGVGGGDEGAGPERPAETTQLLHQAGVAVVDVEVVVAAGGVGLHVEEAERQHDHVTLWDLQGATGALSLGIGSLKVKIGQVVGILRLSSPVSR